jgi:AmmeMemoRadiSam system protein B
MDPEKFYKTVRDNRISMCGYIPATCMLYAARELGASQASIVNYMTSGDITGDYSRVVGYAGVLVS